MVNFLLDESKKDHTHNNDLEDLKTQYEGFLKDFKKYAESLNEEKGKKEDQDSDVDLIEISYYDGYPV